MIRDDDAAAPNRGKTSGGPSARKELRRCCILGVIKLPTATANYSIVMIFNILHILHILNLHASSVLLNTRSCFE
jgi:hypothetical protein